MTAVLITVDTEFSARLHRRGHSARANYESSILGRCPAGDFGTGWQMDALDRFGLKAVFFVDPLPALVLGEGVIADIVGPVLDRGHDVQLHAHTEWLEWAEDSPADGRQGRDMADFSLADQTALLRYGADVLERAGAPRPIAFRAGNYGANDDTLRALAAIGIAWDSSVNPAFLGTACRVDLPPSRNLPVERAGLVEVPVSGLFDRPGHFRPAQVCALSRWEMRAALRHAAAQDHPAFTVVTHSFEMLSRDRTRPSLAVTRRFAAMARVIAAHPGLDTATFRTLASPLRDRDLPRLGAGRLRTLSRIAAQGLARLRYENQPHPA